MSSGAPWLPASTLRSERTAAPFARAVGEWSKAWLGGAGWTAARAFESGTTVDSTVLRNGAAADLRGRPKAMLDLGFALLAIRPRADLTEADLRLLRRVAGKALDDLLARLGAILPGDIDAPASPSRWSLGIGPAASSILAFDVAEAALIAAVRETFRPAGRAGSLAPRAAAWRNVAVDCAAHLGRTSLAVRQIAALERGDIIVLDQAADQPVGLALAGRPSGLRVALGDDGDRTTLTLQD